MSSYTGEVLPSPCTPDGIRNAHLSNDHWGGRINFPAAPAVEVNGGYGQSAVSAYCNPACGPGSIRHEASWVGLGGWRSGALIQAGTSIDSAYGIYGWYEFLDDAHSNPEVPYISPIAAGTQIQIDVHYNAGTSQAYFDIWTNGTPHPVLVNAAHEYFDGSSTEAIDERVYCYTCGAYYYFMDFGYNNWFTLNERPTLTGAWTPFGSAAGDIAVIMYDAANNQMTTPTNLASTTFTDTWNRTS
jgi:hypothetical protein